MKKLRAWSDNFYPDAKMQLLMASDVILRLDMAQESRQLTKEEMVLCQKLKRRVMGLAVNERVRKQQASRITNLRLGTQT